WKVYVDQMLREYQEHWKLLVEQMKLDPLDLGTQEYVVAGTTLEGGTVLGMSNIRLRDGNNFCGKLEYPMKISGVLEFPQLYADFKKVGHFGHYNVSIKDVVVSIDAIVDPLIAQEIIVDVSDNQFGEIELVKDGIMDELMNYFMPNFVKDLFKKLTTSTVKDVASFILHEKSEDLDKAVKLLSPMAVTELLKNFDVAVACDLDDEKLSESPCNFHVTKYKGDNKWRVYFNDTAKKYTKYIPSIVKDLNLDPVQLEPVNKFGVISTLELSQGKLYGLSNITIAEGDHFYAEPGYPIKILGILTFPKLRANYDFVEHNKISFSGPEKGNVDAFNENVKIEIDLMVEPIFTEKVILKWELINNGTLGANGNEIADDDFKEYMQEILFNIHKEKVLAIMKEVEKRISENLIEFVGKVAGELVQSSTLGLSCDKNSKESLCKFFIKNVEDDQ
ncbi:hypothetical protein QAD02_006511, partial [Eretmocerus hayati]